MSRPDLSERNRLNAIHGNSRIGVTVNSGYGCWSAMKARCTSASNKDYPKYGARGISVCERWMNYENFLADTGPRPSLGHSLDRHPNKNGNYEPGNVRWATVTEQGNNRNTNRPIELNGVTKNIAEWARDFGMSRQALRYRINAGWSAEDILGLGLNHNNGRKRGVIK